MLEDGSGPVLEVRWEPIKGRFSHKSQLKRLAVSGRRQSRQSVSVISLPTGWDKALAGFETAAFSWQTPSAGGVGVILYCPKCRTAALIRFYTTASGQNRAIFRHLLESFKDHLQENAVIWSLFDIRAVLPLEFRLLRHRFNTGEFRLTFAAKNQKIELYRWSPASILLLERDLARFAALATDLPAADPRAMLEKGAPALEWLWVAPDIRWMRWWRRIRMGAACRRLRLWHLEIPNRILGVGAEGAKAFDSRLFDNICAAYESL